MSLSQLPDLTNDNNIVKINDDMPKPKTTQPTETHIRILQVLFRLVQGGRAPVISELASELGLAGPSSISPTLNVIERLGLIKIVGGGKRGKRKWLSITDSGKAASGQLGIPFFGEIRAGVLGEILEHPYIRLDLPKMIPYEEGDFLLGVKGESMVGDGILPGDVVLLRPKVEAYQGEIAAVHIGEEYLATLKRIYLDTDRKLVTLRASNPNYPDVIAPSAQVRVAGVFRGLIRNPSFLKGMNNYGV